MSASTPKQDPVLQAQDLIHAGQPEKAASILLRFIQREPKNIAALNTLAEAFIRNDEMSKALYYRQRAAQLAPDIPELLLGQVQILVAMGKVRERIELLREARKRFPNNALAAGDLVACLADTHLLIEAEQVAEEAVKSCENVPYLLATRSDVVFRTGRVHEAVPMLREAISKMDRLEATYASKLAQMLLYCPGATPREIHAAHLVHAKCLADEIVFAPRPQTVQSEPEKKLHVAFVSPDLFTHSVTYFLESVLDHAEREHMSFSLYMTGTNTDVTSARLATKARFLHTKSARPEHLAGQIVADGVDVLFDLAGITKGGNLGTFHLRPAPVQATYIGYPATTGVRAIGYRIVDSLTDPPGTESHCVEKLIRLDPSFLCYRPNPDALKTEPVASKSPSDRPFIFGSFNSPMKLNDPLLKVYSRLLEEVPGSKLMLKFGLFRSDDDQKLWDARFARAGIPLDRLITPDVTQGHVEHLMKYHDMDLALDTFPYHGTTTTCEALLMGMPVVTRAGEQHVSRVGVSLLTNVGHPELIARDEEDFIRIAKDLATNPAKLEAIRGPQLRVKFLSGPICDGPAFGKRFTDAIREMWRQACAPKSAE